MDQKVITCDWLTVIFLHEAYDLMPDITTIINSVKRAGAGDNNAVFLIRDSVSHPTNAGGGLVNIFVLSVEQLVKDEAMGTWNFVQQNDIHIDNKSRYCWKEAFRYIFGRVRSGRTIMISFSHGAAFGIDADTGKVERPAIRTIKVTQNPWFYLDEKDISTIRSMPQWSSLESNDQQLIDEGKIALGVPKDFCSKLDILWISDLAKALNEYLGADRKIDLMVMNNCYMQNFDTGYLLRGKVDYILAAESSLEATGFDFQTLLERINSKPEAGGLELGLNAVSDYVAYYESRGDTYNLARQAISLVATKAFEDALSLYSQFLDLMEAHLEEIIGDLVDIRENDILYVAFTFNHYDGQVLDMVDAFEWVEMVMARCHQLFDGTILPDALPRLKASIVKGGYTGQWYRSWDQQNPNKYGYQGLSVFFPLIKDYDALRPDNPNPTAWCVYFGAQVPGDFEKRWRSFLRRYYALALNPHLS